MRAMFEAEKMTTCFELKKPSPGGGRPAKMINVLKQPEHCREVSRLTEDEARSWWAEMGPDEEEESMNDRAFAAITFTMHEAHHHLIRNTGDVSAVAWARPSERFEPTDDASMHELNSRPQQASVGGRIQA